MCTMQVFLAFVVASIIFQESNSVSDRHVTVTSTTCGGVMEVKGHDIYMHFDGVKEFEGILEGCTYEMTVPSDTEGICVDPQTTVIGCSTVLMYSQRYFRQFKPDQMVTCKTNLSVWCSNHTPVLITFKGNNSDSDTAIELRVYSTLNHTYIDDDDDDDGNDKDMKIVTIGVSMGVVLVIVVAVLCGFIHHTGNTNKNSTSSTDSYDGDNSTQNSKQLHDTGTPSFHELF